MHGASYNQCPLFQELEIRVALNQFLVVVEYPEVEFARCYKGITRYMETHVSLSRPIGIVFKDFLWGGDGPSAHTMADRAIGIHSVLDNWLSLVADL